MQFAYTIVYVSDVSRALQFYQTAFGLETCFLHPSQEYGELATGTTKLAFASHSLAESNLPSGYHRIDPGDRKPLGVEIALMTDDVPTAFVKALQAGGKLVAEPIEKPWGQTVAYLRDPEGMLIELCTPLKTSGPDKNSSKN